MRSSIPLHEADRLNWPTFSVAQSRSVDERAIQDYGVPGIELMENAGTVCAMRILEWIPSHDTPVCILTGAGNNGGDGFVIARVLCEHGRNATVISLVPTSKLRGDARLSYESAKASGVEIEEVLDAPSVQKRLTGTPGVIVDCLLGTGSQGAPREPFATAIHTANEGRNTSLKPTLQRVAIDLPSGLDADTGECSDPTFVADLTLTFVTPKTGMRNPRAEPMLGQIEIIDIGIPDDLKRSLGIPLNAG